MQLDAGTLYAATGAIIATVAYTNWTNRKVRVLQSTLITALSTALTTSQIRHSVLAHPATQTRIVRGELTPKTISKMSRSRLMVTAARLAKQAA